jgi:hypothetical protein
MQWKAKIKSQNYKQVFNTGFLSSDFAESKSKRLKRMKEMSREHCLRRARI